jgi:hypothetical protein
MAGHEEFDELAAAHVLDALDAEEDRRFVEHAEGCALCQDVLRDLSRVAATLAGGVAAVEPPDRLRASLLAAALVERPPAAGSAAPPEIGPGGPDSPDGRDATGGRRERGAAGPPGSRRRHRRSKPVRTVAAVVAAVLALALVGGLAAWGAVQSGRASDRLTALRQRDAVLAGLARPGARTVALPGKNGASAEVVIAGREVFMVTSGLASNDPARTTYVLWAITAAGKPAGVRAFDVGTRPVTLVDAGAVDTGVSTAKAFAVSLEPGRTVPAAPSKVVLG